MVLNLGDKAPDFNLKSTDGSNISLDSLKGNKTILYFYPKDDTPGCTIEACEFRDVYDDFRELDCPIYGISPDNLETHNSFAEEHNLPFNLCVDPDKNMINEYGVEAEYLCSDQESEYLRSKYSAPIKDDNKLTTIARCTFLIDKDGILMHKWMNVNFRGHASSVRDQLHKSFKFDIAF